jgi:serine/threonine protein kinase
VLALLRHPNIIRLYRVLGPAAPTPEMLAAVDRSIRDTMYNPVDRRPNKTMGVVMELHPQTLEQLYRANGPNITAADKERMCSELCAALHYVLQQGFVHLDMKMNNVLVAADGRLVLSDFGTAQPIGADGYFLATQGIAGNPSHKAPEVLRVLNSQGLRLPLRGQPSWECGTMFHEMIVGEHPYPGYPLAGLEPEHYPEVDVGRLQASGVAPALVNATLRLVDWDVADRILLETAWSLIQGAVTSRTQLTPQPASRGATKMSAKAGAQPATVPAKASEKKRCFFSI